MQQALHSPHRDAHCAGDLFRIQILLVPQNHRHPGFLREGLNQLAQLLTQHRVVRANFTRRLRDLIQLGSRLQFAPPDEVDRPVARDFPQPGGAMLRARQLRHLPVQLQEDLLRHFLGRRTIPQVVKGDAEHHRLMLLDDLSELALADRLALRRTLDCRRQPVQVVSLAFYC
jgi:hypothetical protein